MLTLLAILIVLNLTQIDGSTVLSHHPMIMDIPDKNLDHIHTDPSRNQEFYITSYELPINYVPDSVHEFQLAQPNIKDEHYINQMIHKYALKDENQNLKLFIIREESMNEDYMAMFQIFRDNPSNIMEEFAHNVIFDSMEWLQYLKAQLPKHGYEVSALIQDNVSTKILRQIHDYILHQQSRLFYNLLSHYHKAECMLKEQQIFEHTQRLKTVIYNKIDVPLRLRNSYSHSILVQNDGDILSSAIDPLLYHSLSVKIDRKGLYLFNKWCKLASKLYDGVYTEYDSRIILCNPRQVLRYDALVADLRTIDIQSQHASMIPYIQRLFGMFEEDYIFKMGLQHFNEWREALLDTFTLPRLITYPITLDR